jgi:cardiolipin synthase
VRVASAYFVPDALSVDTLVTAQRRGAQVEIIVPGRHTDASVVRRASRSLWGKMLEAGIAIYEYQTTMYHTKVMIVDEVWTTVGSTNFDNRSFRLNDEANLNILDRDFAQQQARLFEQDRARSTRITLDLWRSRPRREKVRDWMAGVFRLQL